jgi:GTP-binding protein YchF
MALQVGIVGLPLVGKTTLFNALTSAHAEASAHAKGQTRPNLGVARVPDSRLAIINKYISTKKLVEATINMVDVAGLVRGASTGEGLGNKFLAHIRDMDALIHVVRCFPGEEVPHVEQSIDPARDIETIETELVLADLEQVSTSLDKARRAARTGDKEAAARAEVLDKAFARLNDGKAVRDLHLTPEQWKLVKSMGLLTAKKMLVVANVGEQDIHGTGPDVQAARARVAELGAPLVPICAKLEAEIAELSPADRGEMLAGMGLQEPALAVLAREAYKLLGLHSFFTAGEPEIRAWTIPIGCKAPQAAGAIHTDLEKSFIKAEVYSVEDLEKYHSEAEIKHHGRLRLEGREYVVRDGDVIHFQAGLAGRK